MPKPGPRTTLAYLGYSMKYDDASWHYGGDFPDDLPEEAGATHIGMFLAGALINDLAGELHIEDSQESIQSRRLRDQIGRHV